MTAVEFALIAPAFFFLILLIMETALIFIAEQVLENAVFEAARDVRIGRVQADHADAAGFSDIVCSRLFALIRCDSPNFYLDVRSYETFASAQVSNPVDEDDAFEDAGEFEFGGPGDIVVVRAYYQWPTNPLYGGLTFGNLANGKRLIGSFTAFRNEPFPEVEPIPETPVSDAGGGGSPS
ncbi:TadE family protein [Afifella sp. IM 167]|uniref:TadE family protein n=1 Tax=Afifella sp. IM 167 TaxID=2033586 RepID=UPI00351D56BA